MFGVALLTLAACSTTPPPPISPHGAPSERPGSYSAPQPPPDLAATGFASLEGWAEEDHAAALQAFASGCGAARDPAMVAVCRRARAVGPAPDGAARQFFEFNFRPAPLLGVGVLTAYFAPEYEARREPGGAFTAPVRPPPPSSAMATLDPLALVDGLASPAPPAGADRAALAAAPAPDALAWMRPEDLFFLQIQGSGLLDFPGGARLKASYAADNGRPFVAIARPMVAAGLLAPGGASGDAIRGWLAAHAGPRAEAVMNQNPRYVFFALTPDDGREPAGAAGAPLPAGRAIAVDPSRHAMGELYWLDAEAPVLTGAMKRYRRLALALDTGSAIRGDVRADLYLGRGAAAGREAGRVRHTLRLVRLMPVGVSDGGG